MVPEDIQRRKDIQRCFEKICENYGVQAGLRMSEPLRDRDQPDMQIAFIDMRIGSYFTVNDQEILKNTMQKGIKSRKDYRRLRSLARTGILNALRSVKDLVEDGIRNLGAEP
jgi:hypothetical protein